MIGRYRKRKYKKSDHSGWHLLKGVLTCFYSTSYPGSFLFPSGKAKSLGTRLVFIHESEVILQFGRRTVVYTREFIPSVEHCWPYMIDKNLICVQSGKWIIIPLKMFWQLMKYNIGADMSICIAVNPSSSQLKQKARSICFPSSASCRCSNLAVRPALKIHIRLPPISPTHSLYTPFNEFLIKEWFAVQTASSPRQLLIKQFCLLTTRT
jgi:hypothetical protein